MCLTRYAVYLADIRLSIPHLSCPLRFVSSDLAEASMKRALIRERCENALHPVRHCAPEPTRIGCLFLDRSITAAVPGSFRENILTERTQSMPIPNQILSDFKPSSRKDIL